MYKKFIKTFLSAFILTILSFASYTSAYAADTASDKTVLPKGIIILIMVIIFIASAVAAGFASFKIKTKNIEKNVKDNTEKPKDQ